MSASSSRLAILWLRSETRLILFGLSGLAAVYLGFLGVSVAAAESFVKRGGYYVMLATFALWLGAVWRHVRTRVAPDEPLTRRQLWLTGGLIALLSLLAIGAEPYRSKILNDEFVLQSTAFNMHYFRDVATMVRGYDIQGVFLSTDNYLDKRPYFYPFLISLVHDLTGYRVANAFLLNSALFPAALALAFAFGRRLARWTGGLLAVLLLGSLPLLGQNATGSGMELLNVVMILAALVLAADLLRAPTDAAFAAFVLTVILLAQSRYESALYAAAAAAVGALAWARAGRVILPAAALVAPLLLIPCALQNKVLSHSPVLWELTEQASTRFSVDYFPKNLRGAWNFFTNTGPEIANSLLLTGAGFAALGWCGWRWLRLRPALRTVAAAPLALACFSLVIFANVLLVFCYYWSSFDDRMAARFALPLHLTLTFAVVLAAAALDRRWPVTRTLLAAAGVFTLGVTTTLYANHYYSHLGIDEIAWESRSINALPPGRRLILTNRSSLPWLLEKKPSILLDRARLVADRLEAQLHDANFTEILVLQTLQPMSAEGDHGVIPAERLPGFRLETVAEKRFGTKLARISRLVGLDEAALAAVPVSSATAERRPAGTTGSP